MTAATTKGTDLTAQLITDPRTMQKVTNMGGSLRVYSVTEELATTSIDDVGDITLLVALPSSAVLHDLRIMADDLDSHSTPALAYDVGLYNGPDKFTVPVSGTNTTYAAFAVLDADAFASAITVGQSAVSTTVTNYRFEAAAAANDIANVNKKLWELVGMDKDPNKMFVIGITITTAAATAVAGTFSMQAFASH